MIWPIVVMNSIAECGLPQSGDSMPAATSILKLSKGTTIPKPEEVLIKHHGEYDIDCRLERFDQKQD